MIGGPSPVSLYQMFTPLMLAVGIFLTPPAWYYVSFSDA
jgi:hypothetical protein